MGLLRAWKKGERGGTTPVLLAVTVVVSMLLLLTWQQCASCRCDKGGEPYLTHRLAAQRQQSSGGALPTALASQQIVPLSDKKSGSLISLASNVAAAGSTQQPGSAAAPTSNAAAAPVDLRLVSRLLPLTNLSALTTGALLDASPGLSSSDTRELVRLHQELYCRSRLHVPDPPNSTRTLFSNVTMFVYAGNDIVSNVLTGAARTWEKGEVQEMLLAIRARVPASPRELSTPSVWKSQASPFVVDIGANLGWFTLNAAAAGATVAAFEAMSSNVALIRASLCANPWLMERTALYGTGLGTRRSSCSIISDVNNKGDGHSICDQDPTTVIAEWKRDTGRTYEVRGAMSVVRLDGLLDHDVQVAKLDVEGFEFQVLQGATGLLRSRNVWFIITECNQAFIKEEGQVAFLKFLDAEGYYVSETGFKGPFLASEKLSRGKKTTLKGVSLFLVKKAIHDAVVAASRAPAGSAGAGRAWSAAAMRRRRRQRRGGSGLNRDGAGPFKAAWKATGWHCRLSTGRKPPTKKASNRFSPLLNALRWQRGALLPLQC